MLLYKLLRTVGDYSCSVWPPAERVVEPVEVLAGDPLVELIGKLTMYGYSERQARLIIVAWAAHAKYDLNQGPQGVKVFCEMCMRRLPRPEALATVEFWPVILAAAAVAAVAAAIYLWINLGHEAGQIRIFPEGVYVMRYGERLWQAELLMVSPKQIAVYERGFDFDGRLVGIERNVYFIQRPCDNLMWYNTYVLEGRDMGLWKRISYFMWIAYFCGKLTHVTGSLYRFDEPGKDPYARPGPWIRPGGRHGTKEYDGFWQGSWWL